jgi:peptidoglycan/LPS O-acetylase OafA/YrhL
MAGSGASKSQYYRPELDVVRFLAFFLVFLAHTLPSTRDPRVAHLVRSFAHVFDAFGNACDFGLSLFFTLSAFLICELLLREREAIGTVGVKQFYLRRVLRIWPLYYLGLALGIGAAFLPGGDPASAMKMSWFAIFMGAWFCAAHGGLNNPANVLWSISVEEQFYLFAPWIIKFISRMFLYVFCLAIILVANATLFYLGKVGAPNYGVWFNSAVQFECFAGGILLSIVLRGRIPRIAMWSRVMLLVFGFLCWFYACYGLRAIFGSFGEHNPGSWSIMCGYALATLGSIMVLVAFLGVPSNLLPNWAIYLGRISFGLYVFHDFTIYLTDRLINRHLASFKDGIINSIKGPIYLLSVCMAFGLTVLIAALSYRYFETPFLKMKKRHAVIQSEPIGTERMPENV